MVYIYQTNIETEITRMASSANINKEELIERQPGDKYLRKGIHTYVDKKVSEAIWSL